MLTPVALTVTQNLSVFGVGRVADTGITFAAARTRRNRVERACAHVDLVVNWVPLQWLMEPAEAVNVAPINPPTQMSGSPVLVSTC